MKRAVVALVLLCACASQGLDKGDVVDGLVQRDFTRPQAQCIADRIFDEYSGSRRQQLADDLNGDHVSPEDKATLTTIVDACVGGTSSS